MPVSLHFSVSSDNLWYLVSDLQLEAKQAAYNISSCPEIFCVNADFQKCVEQKDIPTKFEHKGY